MLKPSVAGKVAVTLDGHRHLARPASTFSLQPRSQSAGSGDQDAGIEESGHPGSGPVLPVQAVRVRGSADELGKVCGGFAADCRGPGQVGAEGNDQLALDGRRGSG